MRPVVLAAWFHDAVYEPLSSDNEHDSADLARRLLVEDSDVGEVARLVELTLTHDPTPDDRNGIALSDADLPVLGSAPARYDEYAADVREEYHLVPDEVFRPGRRKILTGFVAADALFRSPQARRRWEAPARENLAREIDELA
ncbi:HD domain-containing protein [Gordonia sp. (in: high G+C Gram-positive bacteria)]|uniref:HD domain-containing protein n=1 Tax=Gordonia sp. (in: high G+C Gram-positive bacteria) TaxID=84139 RepID=UPI003F95CA46